MRRAFPRHVAITGAAGNLGAALAEALAGRGARVSLSDVDDAGLQTLAQRWHGTAEVYTRALDVTDAASMDGWLHACHAAAALDWVIVNAALGGPAPADLVCESPSRAAALIAVNLQAAVETCRTAATLMSGRGGRTDHSCLVPRRTPRSSGRAGLCGDQGGLARLRTIAGRAPGRHGCRHDHRAAGVLVARHGRAGRLASVQPDRGAGRGADHRRGHSRTHRGCLSEFNGADADPARHAAVGLANQRLSTLVRQHGDRRPIPRPNGLCRTRLPGRTCTQLAGFRSELEGFFIALR